ncbi:MAG: TetR/AcrR family transcriptional regulator [Myxococcota bacterium]
MPGSPHPPRAAPHPPGRRERNKREKLERIVRAATGLFRAQGFEATTGRQICQQAGIATGTLFLYVRDKRELLFLIFRPRAERAFARLPRGLGEDEGVVDGLMRLFGAFLRIYGRDVALARLFVQELLFRSDPAEGMQALSAELRTRVARIVADAVERGELRADVAPDELGQALGAHYVLWIQLWLGTAAVGRRAAERGLRRSLELQLEGIASTSARSAR